MEKILEDSFMTQWIFTMFEALKINKFSDSRRIPEDSICDRINEL